MLTRSTKCPSQKMKPHHRKQILFLHVCFKCWRQAITNWNWWVCVSMFSIRDKLINLIIYRFQVIVRVWGFRFKIFIICFKRTLYRKMTILNQAVFIFQFSVRFAWFFVDFHEFIRQSFTVLYSRIYNLSWCYFMLNFTNDENLFKSCYASVCVRQKTTLWLAYFGKKKKLAKYW